MQSIFNDSYKEYYKIIEEAKTKNRSKKDNYYENHHIIPRSLGGYDTKHNLVLLTPEEHYICHSLLPDFCDGESKAKMLYAWNMMNNTREAKGSIIIGPEKYGELKREFAAYASINNKAFSKTEKGKEVHRLQGELLKIYAQTEEGKTRYKVAGLKLKKFFQTKEGKESAKNRGKKSGETKKKFFQTEEGKAYAEQHGDILRIFYQTEEGKEIAKLSGKKGGLARKAFYQTEEGKENYKNQRETQKLFYQSEEGKKHLLLKTQKQNLFYQSEEGELTKKEISNSIKALPKKQCPHCGIIIGQINYNRHINKYCKILYPKSRS